MIPARRTLLLAGLALLAVLAVRPPHAPPLYDGIGFPDEPYRWIVPPAGAEPTAAATRASVAVPVAKDGTSAAARAFSAEQGPQVAFALAAGSLQVPAGSAGPTLTAAPVATPPAPAGVTAASNLYELTATLPGGGPVRLRTGHQVVVNLRADRATSQQVVIETWDGTGWSQVSTAQVGTDIYAARLDRLPVAFAVVKLGPGVEVTVTAPPPSAVAGTTPTLATPAQGPSAGLWIGLGAALLLVVGGLVAIRVRRSAAAPAHPDGG